MAVKTSFVYTAAVIVFTCVYSGYGQGTAPPALCWTGSGTYQCNNGGGCYSEYDRCDSYTDCADSSDELNCDFCSSGFHCTSSRQCVESRKVCDSHSDCPYGEDENLSECDPTIWLYWTEGQLAGIIIGFVLFLVIVITIVVVVHKNCKE